MGAKIQYLGLGIIEGDGTETENVVPPHNHKYFRKFISLSGGATGFVFIDADEKKVTVAPGKYEQYVGEVIAVKEVHTDTDCDWALLY